MSFNCRLASEPYPNPPRYPTTFIMRLCTHAASSPFDRSDQRENPYAPSIVVMIPLATKIPSASGGPIDGTRWEKKPRKARRGRPATTLHTCTPCIPKKSTLSAGSIDPLYYCGTGVSVGVEDDDDDDDAWPCHGMLRACANSFVLECGLAFGALRRAAPCRHACRGRARAHACMHPVPSSICRCRHVRTQRQQGDTAPILLPPQQQGNAARPATLCRLSLSKDNFCAPWL